MLRDFVETPIEMPIETPIETPETIPQQSQDEEPIKLSIPRALWNAGLQRKEKQKQTPREKSTRTRKPNSMLKDFVGEGVPKTTYVILGGVRYLL
jgi:hypothetical protein